MQKMALWHIFRAILETGGGGEGGSVNLIKQKRGGGQVGRGREREMCSAWRSFLPGGFCNNEKHTQVPYSTATRGRGKEGVGIMVHQVGGSIPLCCNSAKAIAGEKSRGGRGDRTKKGNGGRGKRSLPFPPLSPVRSTRCRAPPPPPPPPPPPQSFRRPK